MLALVLMISLGQCTKDTDCKGDRICNAGECVAPAESPPPAPPLVVERPPAAPAAQPAADNPYRAHRIAATILFPSLWVTTVVLDLLIGDAFWLLTAIPVFGPVITFFTVLGNPNAYFLGPTAPVLLWLAAGLQAGAVAYLIAAGVSEARYQPPPVSFMVGPGIGGTVAVRW